jgi:hypothetical protein
MSVTEDSMCPEAAPETSSFVWEGLMGAEGTSSVGGGSVGKSCESGSPDMQGPPLSDISVRLQEL